MNVDSSAFFVNLTLGSRLLRHPRITHAVAGHIHRGASQRIERAEGPPVHFEIIPSDYGKPADVPWARTADGAIRT